MRGDISNLIDFITNEDLPMYNKAELARRYDCDLRTIDRYLKIQSGELKPKGNTREYHSKLDDYKDLIIHKVDTYGCTAMALYISLLKRKVIQVNTVLLLTLLNDIKTLKLKRQLYDLKPIQGFKHKLTGRKI